MYGMVTLSTGHKRGSPERSFSEGLFLLGWPMVVTVENSLN